MSNRQQSLTTVVENRSLCREHYRLVLSLPSFARTDPGQFIQIACRDVNLSNLVEEQGDWQTERAASFRDGDLHGGGAFLRRPFSLAGRRDLPNGTVELEIIHRVVGVGTRWLLNLKPGDRVSILGPLGNRFELPQADQTAVLVGGGVGIPPMLYLAERLRNRPAVAFCGATTRDLLALAIDAQSDPNGIEPRQCIAEFADCGVPSIITTDDGSYGFRGFVTQALERWLDSISTQSSPRSMVLYTCGPEPMMKRVADIAIARNIACQVAVERAMACGMGTCQSCCIRVKKPDPKVPPLAGKDWCWRLACTDGPIFQAAELLW